MQLNVKKMSKLNLSPQQYENLKRFLEFFFKKTVTHEANIIAAIDEMEKKAPARAATATLMMINDCIEMSIDWNSEKVRSLDVELKSRGIISLTELRRQYSKQYARVIKRGYINSENEYYLLKGVLDDGASLDMTGGELDKLMLLIETYENRK